jgi:hypothetical protein
MIARARFLSVAALAAMVAAPVGARAQQPPQTQGPMTVEREHDGFAIAPEVEVGRIGSTTATMAGAYGGWVIDNTVLIGGGAYFQTNRSASRKMDYGGFVVEWLARTDQAVGFGARALIGGGQATLSDTLSVSVPTPVFRADGRLDHFDVRNQFVPVRLRTDFFVAEPQADVLLNFSRRARLRIGAGYRAIGGARGRNGQLSGATGSIALVFGGASITH